MVQEEKIPIDIYVGKLVEWLISRRHIKRNWPEAIHVVREKINNAIQDMPEHPEITKLLSGTYINFFHCQQIVEILHETEKDSKNMFGWYTSQRMKDWRDIVYKYEADNIYLAEASQFLIRNVSYEIPSLKKQIAKCQQIQEDCIKKVEMCLKGSSSATDKYFSACKKIGIAGENIQGELLGLLIKLPEKLLCVGNKTKELNEAKQFYEDYLHFLISNELSCLPMLNFIIEHGDVTVYEWKHGEAPKSIETQCNLKIHLSTEIKEECDITTRDEIDFGPDDTAELSIDWGEDENSALFSSCDFIEKEVSGSSSSPPLFSIDEKEVKSSGGGGIATGHNAQTLLFHETTRNQFINELLELEGFLTQRIVELNVEENTLSMSLFSNSPKRSLQYQNLEAITNWLKILTEIKQELTATSMHHLFMISSSPRYVDRLSESLKNHLKERDRMDSLVEPMRLKEKEAIHQQRILVQQLQLITSRTKQLQDNVQKKISAKYSGRQVNLMGGIQFI